MQTTPSTAFNVSRAMFYRRYDVLLSNWHLLTVQMQDDIESLRQELHEHLAHWKPRQPAPDWKRYFDRMNAIAVPAESNAPRHH
jgi:hypothetical protein